MENITYSKINYIDPNELKPYHRNTKKHPDEQLKKLTKLIQNYGFPESKAILVDEDLTIIAGHGRRLSAISAGLKEVPYQIVSNISDADVKAMRIADNAVAESEWDYEFLKLEYQDLELDDFDMDLLSLDDIHLEQIELNFDEENNDFDESKEDEIPNEDEVETRAKTGDIWQLGNHYLLCGDCTNENNIKALLSNKKVDMVFTDPPYGIKTSIANDDLSETELYQFNLKWGKIAFDIMKNNSSCVVFHSTRLFWTALDALRQHKFKFLRYLTLYKPNDCTYPWHRWILKSESILLFEKGKSEFITVEPYQHDTISHLHGKDQSKDRGGHPCCKPISFITDFIAPFKANLVFDFFLGSGTTLIACEKTNRICYGTEISEHYCDVIITRWENLTGKTATLLKNIA
jgi:DNA modification methylase